MLSSGKCESLVVVLKAETEANEKKKTDKRKHCFFFFTLDSDGRLLLGEDTFCASATRSCRSPLVDLVSPQLRQEKNSIMAPAARRKAGNGGSRQVAAAAADGDDDNAAKRRRQPSSATPSAATKTLTTPTPLTAAEAADACELEELGGIDPATSFLYTPHTLTGLVIGKKIENGRFFSFPFLSFPFLVSVSPRHHRPLLHLFLS